MLRPGTATHAPRITVNGLMPGWCGRPIHEMPPGLVRAMRQFITAQAFRTGFSDGLQGTQDVEHSSPFHPSFFYGEPHRLWRLHYLTGANSNPYYRGLAHSDLYSLRAMSAAKILTLWTCRESGLLANDPASVPWASIIQVLHGLADAFEASYRRLGLPMPQHPLCRGTAVALTTWFDAPPTVVLDERQASSSAEWTPASASNDDPFHSYDEPQAKQLQRR